MLGQILGQRLGIPLSFFGLYFELGADAAFDDFSEWSGAIGRLPQNGRGRVQRKQCRALPGHDQHFFAQHAGCDSRTACNVEFHIYPISSQTRASGTKVSR